MERKDGDPVDPPGWKKVYPKLRGAERFALAARAVLRGDPQEIRRLVQTCPWQEASRLDGEFLAPKHAAAAASQAMAVPGAFLLGWRHALATLERFLLSGVGELTLAEGGEALAGFVALARDRVTAELRALVEASRELDRDQGLPPGFLLLGLPPSVEAWLEPSDVHTGGSDPELVGPWRAFLAQAWEESLRAEPPAGRTDPS